MADVDHSPDLWWRYALQRRPLVVLVLHGWEWLAALAALGVWAGFPWWLTAVLVGYGLHLATDHLFNGGYLLCYSLVYRAFHRFQQDRLIPEWDIDRSYDVLQKELPFAIALVEWWQRRSLSRSQASHESPAARVSHQAGRGDPDFGDS